MGYAFSTILGLIVATTCIITGLSNNEIVFALLSFIVGLIVMLIGFALMLFSIIAAIKAYKGEIYKIPVIGNFAEQWS